MKNIQLTILNSFKLLKARSIRLEKTFPLSRITASLLPYLGAANKLSLGRLERVSERIRVSNNFLQMVHRMYRNHGAAFTIKWLKASSVALQKYIGGDPIASLRELEPNLPLPRLINGCPAYINKRDRSLMRDGNTWVIRF